MVKYTKKNKYRVILVVNLLKTNQMTYINDENNNDNNNNNYNNNNFQTGRITLKNRHRIYESLNNKKITNMKEKQINT